MFPSVCAVFMHINCSLERVALENNASKGVAVVCLLCRDTADGLEKCIPHGALEQFGIHYSCVLHGGIYAVWMSGLREPFRYLWRCTQRMTWWRVKLLLRPTEYMCFL